MKFLAACTRILLASVSLNLKMAESNLNDEKQAEKPALTKAASEAMRKSDKDEGGRSLLETTAEQPFPSTLKGFEYDFNEEGQLRHIETKEPFNFLVSEDRSYNQKRYEALGEVITETVYGLLESKGNLKKQYIPEEEENKDLCSFIFSSEDALTNEDKLLVIIHGSGVVRAGQWTRKLIINEDLDHGTQLPYIKQGMEKGYGIIVLNTNRNIVTVDGEEIPIKHNESPEDHGRYVWEKFIAKAKAKHIAIVAHSYGGVVTVDLAYSFKEDFEKRVFAIGFTDSVHFIPSTQKSIGKLFEKKAVNWVTSSEPIGTEMRSSRPGDAKRVSAGHEKHEWTSWSSFEAVFEYFDKMYSSIKESEPEVETITTDRGDAGEKPMKEVTEKQPESVEDLPVMPADVTDEKSELTDDNHSVTNVGSSDKESVVDQDKEPQSEEKMDTDNDKSEL